MRGSERRPVDFRFRIGARSRLFLRLAFGVRPDRDRVRIDETVEVRFGYFRFRTELRNIRSYRIEGPWLWLTAIGVRRGLRHGDVSFAGSPRGGVRMDFHVPVRWSVFRVPAIYVGVEDLEGFARELRARGIEGIDGRRPGAR